MHMRNERYCANTQAYCIRISSLRSRDCRSKPHGPSDHWLHSVRLKLSLRNVYHTLIIRIGVASHREMLEKWNEMVWNGMKWYAKYWQLHCPPIFSVFSHHFISFFHHVLGRSSEISTLLIKFQAYSREFRILRGIPFAKKLILLDSIKAVNWPRFAKCEWNSFCRIRQSHLSRFLVTYLKYQHLWVAFHGLSDRADNTTVCEQCFKTLQLKTMFQTINVVKIGNKQFSQQSIGPKIANKRCFKTGPITCDSKEVLFRNNGCSHFRQHWLYWNIVCCLRIVLLSALLSEFLWDLGQNPCWPSVSQNFPILSSQ